MKRPNVPVEQKALAVLSALMNNAVVEVMNSRGDATANDRFIDGYFALFRLLIQVAADHPSLRDYAKKQVTSFLSSTGKRNKKEVRNLGEWLIMLLVSDSTWSDVAVKFTEECEARNVFWYIQGTRNSPGRYPELKNLSLTKDRTTKVFAATKVSRSLVCFQVQFLRDAQGTDLDGLDARNGLTNLETKEHLKSIYQTISEMTNWKQHFEWCQLPVPTNEERCNQLIEAVKLSNQHGYTGGQNSGGQRRQYNNRRNHRRRW